MFGPVVTPEAHPVYAGAYQQTNNTAEVFVIVGFIQCLLPLGPVAREAHVCTFFDSQCAADICFGAMQPRSNVRWPVLVNTFFWKPNFVSLSDCGIFTVMEATLGMDVQTARVSTWTRVKPR